MTGGHSLSFVSPTKHCRRRGAVTCFPLFQRYMKQLFLFVLLVCWFARLSFSEDKIAYPKAPSSDQTDDYFGTKVADSFRPLEDLDAPATRKWIEEQNKITFDYLEKISERKKINDRLTALWNY